MGSSSWRLDSSFNVAFSLIFGEVSRSFFTDTLLAFWGNGLILLHKYSHWHNTKRNKNKTRGRNWLSNFNKCFNFSAKIQTYFTELVTKNVQPQFFTSNHRFACISKVIMWSSLFSFVSYFFQIRPFKKQFDAV